MQDPKEEPQVSTRKPKTIQELQPNKVCKCGACEPKKPKLPEGIRRLKIQPKCIDYTFSRSIVPQIMLQGKWLEKVGFECNEHVVITTQNGKLIIQIEKE